MISHDFSRHGDGLVWCDTEGIPSDFCDDEDRCSNECICNVGDPDVRDRNVELYEGVYGDEVDEPTLLAMALQSALYELGEWS